MTLLHYFFDLISKRTFWNWLTFIKKHYFQKPLLLHPCIYLTKSKSNKSLLLEKKLWKWKFVKSDKPAEEKKKLTEKESHLMKNQLITTLGGKFLGWNFEVEFWSKYWHTSMYPLCNQPCLYSLVLSSTHRQTIGIYRVGHKGPKFLNHFSLILNLNKK